MNHYKTLLFLGIITFAALLSSCDADSDKDAGMDAGVDSSGDASIDTNSDTSEDTSDSGTESDDTGDAGADELGDAGTDVDTDDFNCESQEAYNPVTGQCVDCRHKECVLPGETGLYKFTTAAGKCICDTEPGYYFSESRFQAVLCDVDQDGWTTIVAKQFMESSDVALRDTANCHLRTVDKIVFQPEEATGTYIPLNPPLPLYEPSGRDADSEMQDEPNKTPPYGGRRLKANELNSFTKACVTTIADYNGNSVPDVEEWEGHDALNSAYSAYAPFAYFLELHHGWYESPGNTGSYGTYYIGEKYRGSTAEPPNNVPLGAFSESGALNYWENCPRRMDQSFDPKRTTVGMDYAWVDDNFGGKMFHHSQFKCLQVASVTESLDANKPYLLKKEVIEEDFILNRCDAIAGHPPSGHVAGQPSTYNPFGTELSCTENSEPLTGTVAFAIVDYKNYDHADAYVRGCVNECVYYDEWPGLRDCEAFTEGVTDCDVLMDEWGKGSCGCNGNFAPPNCTACKENYDFSTGCTTCIGNWDLDSWCTECKGGFDPLSGCSACLDNYDIETGCTTCIAGYDPSTQCQSCYDDPLNGYWDEASGCTQCNGNWDIVQGCTTCKNHYVNLGDNCGTCPNLDATLVDLDDPDALVIQAEELKILGNWDPEKECNECIFYRLESTRSGSSQIGSLAQGFWSMESNCTQCKDLYTGEQCTVCGDESAVGQGVFDDSNAENGVCDKTANLVQNGSSQNSSSSELITDVPSWGHDCDQFIDPDSDVQPFCVSCIQAPEWSGFDCTPGAKECNSGDSENVFLLTNIAACLIQKVDLHSTMPPFETVLPFVEEGKLAHITLTGLGGTDEDTSEERKGGIWIHFYDQVEDEPDELIKGYQAELSEEPNESGLFEYKVTVPIDENLRKMDYCLVTLSVGIGIFAVFDDVELRFSVEELGDSVSGI